MGYTHYWKRPLELDQDRFDAFVTDAKCLAEAIPDMSGSAGGYYADEVLEIAGGLGDGKPEFTSDLVYFNGKEPLDHETFAIPRVVEDSFDFCKTARKPYDLLVTAVLCAFHKHFPEATITSDGDLADWQEGIEFCHSVLGYGEFPVKMPA